MQAEESPCPSGRPPECPDSMRSSRLCREHLLIAPDAHERPGRTESPSRCRTRRGCTRGIRAERRRTSRERGRRAPPRFRTSGTTQARARRGTAGRRFWHRRWRCQSCRARCEPPPKNSAKQVNDGFGTDGFRSAVSVPNQGARTCSQPPRPSGARQTAALRHFEIHMPPTCGYASTTRGVGANPTRKVLRTRRPPC